MVPFHLTSPTYLLWKRQFEAMTEAFDLFGFVCGTVIPPSAMVTSDAGVVSPNPAFTTWKAKDRKLLSVIFATLSQESMAEVIDCRDACSA